VFLIRRIELTDSLLECSFLWDIEVVSKATDWIGLINARASSKLRRSGVVCGYTSVRNDESNIVDVSTGLL